MVINPYFAFLILFLLSVNYGNSTNDDEFGELLGKQLIGKVKKPSTLGSCPRIVTEVISWTRNDAESTNPMSYDVTVKVCRKNCVLLSSLEEEQEQRQESHCQTCERTVTVQKEPFEILDEVDNGCDDNVSDDSELELRSSFEKFVKEYKKAYENKKVREERFRIFRDNLAEAEQLQKNEKGTATYGINEFSDLTDEEFGASHGGYLPVSNYLDQPEQLVYDEDPLPRQFDWRTKGIITRVKNQGLCGACWAFAATGVLEAQYARKHGKLLELSEQELVDCDKIDQGCSGGLMLSAFEAIKRDLGGLVQASDYEYRESQKNCTVDRTKHVVTINDFERIKKFDANSMARYVVNKGPIASALNGYILKRYKGGIIHNNCSDSLNHEVLIVGFGEEINSSQRLSFWIAKNSWKPTWGEEGYFRIIRGQNHCGIESFSSIAYVN